MARPKTRTELVNYCLRKLGAPVIQIDVDERQIEDRIDDALAFFQEYHFDAVERIFLKHQITATVLTFSSPPATSFQRGEPIIGSVSGKGSVIDAPEPNKLRIRTVEGVFVPNQNIVGQNSGAVGTIPVGAGNVVIGDIDKRFIEVDPGLMAVNNVYMADAVFGSTNNLLDARYQMAASLIQDVGRLDLVGYSMVRSYMSLIQHMLVNQPRYEFNRTKNKIDLQTDWMTLPPGTWVIMEGLSLVDMDEHPDTFSTFWLLKYATALIKQQWGTNLKTKFQGVQLAGGHTIDGQTLYNEATAEIEALEEKAKTEFQEPPIFIMG